MNCIEVDLSGFSIVRETMMKTSVRVVFILVLLAIPLVMASCTTLTGTGAQPGGSPPVITNSFASEELFHGDIWRVYVQAHDPDGDMRQFVCVLSRLGYGSYSPEYVIVKKRHREKMRGCLTFLSGAGGGLQVPEWTRLTLTVHIRDRAGLTSDKVVFPVVLSQGAKQGPPPPPFDAGELDRLGAIPFELKAPGAAP
jgi:predicted small secreted protein